MRTIAKELAESILASSAKVSLDYKSISNAIFQMMAHKELVTLIKITHHYAIKSQLCIILDTSSNNVANLTNGKNEDPVYYQKEHNPATIYFGASHSEDQATNRLMNQCCLLYGITLFVMDVVFNQDAALLKKIDPLEISDAFANQCLIKDNLQDPLQLLANMTQLIWAEQSAYNASNYCPELMKFYREQFIPACETHLDLLENQNKSSLNLSASVLPNLSLINNGQKSGIPTDKEFTSDFVPS